MSHTIAAVATPLSAGGIGVIRISGEDAIEIADKVVKTTSGKPLSSLKGYTAAHGKVYLQNEAIDECVALVFRAPRSYTGENTVEFVFETKSDYNRAINELENNAKFFNFVEKSVTKSGRNLSKTSVLYNNVDRYYYLCIQFKEG